jgi:hypothetical protein
VQAYRPLNANRLSWHTKDNFFDEIEGADTPKPDLNEIEDDLIAQHCPIFKWQPLCDAIS